MSVTLLTIYVLIWPVIASVVFFVLIFFVIKDLKQAKKSGKSLV